MIAYILVIDCVLMKNIESKIRAFGKELGFNQVRITSAKPFLRDEAAAISRVKNGLMDGLSWYTEERVHRSTHPELLLPEAKSIISLGISYFKDSKKQTNNVPRGKIARYAWGDDYHKVIKRKLKEFSYGLEKTIAKPIRTRIFVDDGPMNDRAAAARSGLGWFGKNTNILTQEYGSRIFLSQVITDLELRSDTPLKKNCGDCVICIDDCPTGAIVAPYVIDNRRCISFLTIELRGSIPRELRPLIGDWVFGCDICQEVCPVNRKISSSKEPLFEQKHDFEAPSLIPLLALDDISFQKRFHNSPIKRTKRIGLQRNVCVALGNIGDKMALPALEKTLLSSDKIVREHAAWAIGKIGGPKSISILNNALKHEHEPQVTKEILLSLTDKRS